MSGKKRTESVKGYFYFPSSLTDLELGRYNVSGNLKEHSTVESLAF